MAVAETETNNMMDVGEEILSLADLGGVPMDDVEEVRFTLTPAGAFVFEVENVEMTRVKRSEQDVNAVKFTFKIADVLALQNPEQWVQKGREPGSFVGTRHTEIMTLRDLEEVGRVKAFMIDTGFVVQGSLGDCLEGIKGHYFRAPIRHNKAKNDPSIVYANMDRTKVKPAAEETVE